MTLGSHNTFTYLPPRKWWMYLGRWIYRCQDVPAEDQVAAGVRVLDVRVRYDSDGRIRFAHGLYESKESYCLAEFARVIFTEPRKNPEMFTVRVILETSAPDDLSEQLFWHTCKYLEETAPDNVTLIGGNRKCDWYHVYEFTTYAEVTQCVSSMADDTYWWEKLWPAAYARRKNSENRAKWANVPGPVLFDFVQKYL